MGNSEKLVEYLIEQYKDSGAIGVILSLVGFGFILLYFRITRKKK